MPAEKQMRIVVIFGNIPMWGHERANIQVYDELRKRGVESLFLTHRGWGHLHVEPALEARGLAWTHATFVGRFERGMGLVRWCQNLWAMARGSVELALIARRFRATGIHVSQPLFFINFQNGRAHV
jgi:hypothetical protein